jgi:hypothetical protein
MHRGCPGEYLSSASPCPRQASSPALPFLEPSRAWLSPRTTPRHACKSPAARDLTFSRPLLRLILAWVLLRPWKQIDTMACLATTHHGSAPDPVAHALLTHLSRCQVDHSASPLTCTSLHHHRTHNSRSRLLIVPYDPCLHRRAVFSPPSKPHVLGVVVTENAFWPAEPRDGIPLLHASN